jgi:hypothetical protein
MPLSRVRRNSLLAFIADLDLARETGRGRVHQHGQGHRPAAVQENGQNAQRGPAQAVGIGRARGRQADREAADQRVDAIGDGDHRADLGPGQGVARAARHVVLANGRGHLGRLSGKARVMRAHHALQIRELEHHLGHQIGLAQGARPIDQGAVEPDLGGELCRGLANALHLGADTAEPGLEHHIAEPGRILVERALAILAEKEHGIGQPRGQDPLVARLDHIEIARDRAGDGHEAIGQRAVRVFHGEVALVRAHGRDDHFLGQLQIRGVERAAYRLGILDQIRDLA